MDPIFQTSLQLLFYVLYNILYFFKIYRFSKTTELGRYFYSEDVKRHQKNKKRYLHWAVFRPQKNEYCLSVYNIENLSFQDIIDLGNRYVASYKRSTVAGYCHGNVNDINQICAGTTILPLNPEFWPLPHYRHINLNPKLNEPQYQLRGQLLAKQLNKTLLDQSVYKTEYF